MLNLLTEKFEKQLKQESTKRQSTLVEELNQLNLEEDSDFKSREYPKMFRYQNINETPWFREIIRKAVKPSERSGNRIFVYFESKEDALEAIDKLEKRNINHIDEPMENTYDNTFRVDILYNFREDRPSKKDRKRDLVLESSDEKQCKNVKTEDFDSNEDDYKAQVFEAIVYDNQNNIVDQFEEIYAHYEDEAEDIALEKAWEDSNDAWEIEHMSDEEFEDIFGEDITFDDVKQAWKDDHSVTIKFINKE